METCKQAQTARADNIYKYKKNINRGQPRDPPLTTYHHHTSQVQHTHSHHSAMLKSTQDHITFPDAISDGGAIAAITIGSLIVLVFLLVFIRSIAVRPIPHCNSRRRRNNGCIRTSPSTSLLANPPMAVQYPNRHTVHAQE
jgi:hypothetical protein